MPSVRASCCPLPLATPSGERVNHQSSLTLLCLNYKWGLFSIIKQICHASVGNMMECFPSGGWFSLGLRPRENHPPSVKHSIMLPPLVWHICIMALLSYCTYLYTFQPLKAASVIHAMPADIVTNRGASFDIWGGIICQQRHKGY